MNNLISNKLGEAEKLTSLSADWASIFLSEKFQDRLQRLAFSIFPRDQVESDSAVNYVLNEIPKNDYKALRSYQNTDNSRKFTFLTVVARRILVDYFRSRYGRIRPPLWVSRIHIYSKIWSYLMAGCNGWPIEEVARKVADEFNIELSKADDYVRLIKPTVTSRVFPNFVSMSLDDNDNNECFLSFPDENVCEFSPHPDLEWILSLLLFEKVDINSLEVSEQAQIVLNEITAKLGEESLLLLKLVYVEGMNVSKAAKILGMKAYNARRNLSKSIDAIASKVDVFI